MRTFISLIIFCFSSIIVLGQKLDLEKASPFTAVKWEGDQPIVQFENEWYHFEMLDHFNKEELLVFCENKYARKWQKRFSEDLVEVLEGMGHHPNQEVKLVLSKEGVSNLYIGVFTFENRQRVLQFNRSVLESPSRNESPQVISKAEAIEDLKQFERILESTSSYAQLSKFDYESAIRKLSTEISSGNKKVDINLLTNELGQIMSEIGDRHSSIKNESFQKENHMTYDLKLPFGLTSIDGYIVATKQGLKDTDYTYFNSSYPRVKSINGLAIETLIDSYNFRAKKAPIQARLLRACSAIENYGRLIFRNNKKCPNSIEVVFSDGINDKSEMIDLTTDTKSYMSPQLLEHYERRAEVEQNENFEGLSQIMEGNIGYINIPKMYHYEDIPGLEVFIKNTLNGFSNTKALIIDIRNNPGGGREILQTFASYIVQPTQSPWVANVAYLRTDNATNKDEESMSGRYLFTYNSEKLLNEDREAIDHFKTNYQEQRTFDNSKFSHPYYMVLHNGKEHYKQPVYILVNENSFSAATVFTSAFKGLSNVRIVGEITDGSSGNSRILYLNNSNISVKVSTMLSFQRNGKTLDGNGTVPDIVIPADEAQVLLGVDTQLSKLIDLINNS